MSSDKMAVESRLVALQWWTSSLIHIVHHIAARNKPDLIRVNIASYHTVQAPSQ